MLYKTNEYEHHKELAPDDIMSNLLKYGKDYAACIHILEQVKHKVLPILLGSMIDRSIRGDADFVKHAGAFILKGIKLLPSFLSNNLRSGHVYRPSNIYKWHFSEQLHDEHNTCLIHNLQYPIEDDGSDPTNVIIKKVKMISSRRIVEKREKKKGYSINETQLDSPYKESDIENLLNRTSPLVKIDKKHAMTLDDYIKYFDFCIENFPALDDLSNKTIITAPTIFHMIIENCTKNPQYMSKLPSMLNGNLFHVLSSKVTSYVKNDDFKTAYVPVEGHRVSLIPRFVSTIKRHISHVVRNSDALKLPRDSIHFICPLNIKEMKNAGETMALSQFVTVAPVVPLEELVVMLDELHQDDAPLKVCIEGYLSKFRLTKQNVIRLKQRFILGTMMYKEEYLVIYNQGRVPVKYSPRYNMCVGVYEAFHTYKDAFDDYVESAKFGAFALNFHRSLMHMPPAKSTVSINNMKGACCTLRTRTDMFAFIYSIGFTNSAIMTMPKYNEDWQCADSGRSSHSNNIECVSFHDPSKFMLINTSKIGSYIEYAEKGRVTEDQMPESVKAFFTKLEHQKSANRPLINADTPPNILGVETYEENGHCYRDLIKTPEKFTNWETTMINYLGGNYIKPSNKLTDLQKEDPLLGIDFEKRDDNRIQLYTALSNIHCDTVEDGIVLDSTFCENSPLKIISITLSLRVFEYNNTQSKQFKKNTNPKPNGKYVYFPVNKKIKDDILFGVLIADSRVVLQKRRSVTVTQSFIKNTYRYLITMNDPSSTAKTIDSFLHKEKDSEKMSIIIHYHYCKPLGVGIKLSNLHGQKDVVSSVKDLSVYKTYQADGTVIETPYKFYQKDGTIVHPQVLFSHQSLVGRMTSSQTINMMNSPKLAVSEYGEVVAPLTYYVHQIESDTKCKSMFPKNDLMTSENGFTVNGLVATMNIMSQQYPLNDTVSESPFLIELMKLRQLTIDLCPSLKENYTEGISNTIQSTVSSNEDDDRENTMSSDSDSEAGSDSDSDSVSMLSTKSSSEDSAEYTDDEDNNSCGDDNDDESLEKLDDDAGCSYTPVVKKRRRL